jgi:beta-lactamase class A
VKAGKVRLDDKLTLNRENQVEGSGVLAHLQPGLQLTVEDVVTLMMIVSDNTATNMLLDRVSIHAINARLAALGLKNTYLYRKVFKTVVGPVPPDQPKFGLGKTTAREMAEAMESIERCDLKDQVLCGRMLGIMRHQQDQSMIPRYLESSDKGPVIAIADKVGQDDGVRNDVALIDTTSGPIVISIFTWQNQDNRWIPENRAEVLIANLAKRIVETWAPAAN